MRTSPVRAVCSTRRSGSTASAIGSPGKSSRVTFWKLASAGGSAGAAAAPGPAGTVRAVATMANTGTALSSRFLMQPSPSEPEVVEVPEADLRGGQRIGGGTRRTARVVALDDVLH